MVARRGAKGGAGKKLIRTAAVIAVLIVAGLILHLRVFVVRSVTIEGTRILSEAEVLEASGIRIGEGMLTLNEGKIRDRINADRYLNFESIWRDFPDHVVLRISENMPRAKADWNGMLVLIDKDGIVMERTNQWDLALAVPQITGVRIRRANVGDTVVLEAQSRLEAITEILRALETTGLSGWIEEINVSRTEDLYLVTYDGVQIGLGDQEDMERKLTLAGAALENLRRIDGVTLAGSELDVTAGSTADFIPARQ